MKTLKFQKTRIIIYNKKNNSNFMQSRLIVYTKMEGNLRKILKLKPTEERGIKRGRVSAVLHSINSFLEASTRFCNGQATATVFPHRETDGPREKIPRLHRDQLTWRCSESVLFRGYNRGFEILRGQEFELGKKQAVIFRGTSILFTLDQHFLWILDWKEFPCPFPYFSLHRRLNRVANRTMWFP